MGNLFSELKRRNVVRVGIAYLVVGWLIIEVLDTVAPRLGLPDWVPTFFIVAVLDMITIPVRAGDKRPGRDGDHIGQRRFEVCPAAGGQQKPPGYGPKNVQAKPFHHWSKVPGEVPAASGIRSLCDHSRKWGGCTPLIPKADLGRHHRF